MQFGKDFWKVFNLVIAIIRLIAGTFGDEEDQKAVADSKARTADSNPEHIV